MMSCTTSRSLGWTSSRNCNCLSASDRPCIQFLSGKHEQVSPVSALFEYWTTIFPREHGGTRSCNNPLHHLCKIVARLFSCSHKPTVWSKTGIGVDFQHPRLTSFINPKVDSCIAAQFKDTPTL